MKLLITGGNGQLGKEWIDFCESNGIDFQSFGSEELDITNSEQIEDKISQTMPDVIINCAAYTKVDDAEDNKTLSEKINGKAVKKLARICKEKNIKLVHYSTDYVFSGNFEDKEKYPTGYPENAKTDPINQYGKSKWLGEREVLESRCDYLLIRLAWLCGKHGNNFVKTMLRLGKEKESLDIVNDQFGSPTFCEDVVKKTSKLLENSESGIFHISSEGIVTWYDFATEIFRLLDTDIELNAVSSSEFPTKAHRPSFSKLSTQKISTIDGIEIQDWKVGLQKLMNQLV